MISLIFPMYNPGLAAERCFHRMREFLQFRHEPWEVLFVSDGSTDNSPTRLRQLCHDHNEHRFRVIEYTPNRGKGFAVRTGMLAARGDYRLFTDIDLHFLQGIGGAVDALKSGAAMVIASRTHSQSEFVAPFRLMHYIYRRKLQSLAFSRAVRTLLPISQRDTQAGLKGMTAAVAEQILPRTRRCGFSFDCEWLMAAVRLQIPVKEIPVRVDYEDELSTTRTFTALRMLQEVWRIRKDWGGKIPDPQVIPLPGSQEFRRDQAA